MRRIAERTEVSVMWRNDVNTAAGTHQAVEFFDGPHHVADVFDDVNRPQQIEGIIFKRVGKPVEIANHVGLGARVDVDADGAWILVDPAADVKNSHPFCNDCRGRPCGRQRSWPGLAILRPGLSWSARAMARACSRGARVFIINEGTP